MTNPKKSLAEIINKSRLMIAGLRHNAPEVARRGADSSFVVEYENELRELERLDEEQERLKAQLKSKTEEVDAKKRQVESKLAEAKKVVKLATPKAQWVEFGMEDKRSYQKKPARNYVSGGFVFILFWCKYPSLYHLFHLCWHHQ